MDRRRFMQGTAIALAVGVAKAQPGWSTWLGLVGPAGMPAEVVTRINAEVVKLLARKDVQDKLASEGSLVVTGIPAQFGEFIRAEHAKWGALIREAQIRVE